MRISRKTLLRLSASLAFLPAPALAQTGQPATAADGQPADQQPTAAGQIPDIVITAQQRGESLQRAAVPVSVVSGADLIREGINGLGILQKSVPSLQVASSATGNLIFIRGVGNFNVSANSDPPAAFNIDGVYVGRSGSTVGSFFDIERVEVLKGPQGTLYGRNATAGAINVLPVQPRYDDLGGYATATYGNYDAITAEGAINLPIDDHAAFRLSGGFSRHDGFLRDGTSDENSFGLRAQMKVDLTPDLTVRVSGDYAHVEGGGGASYLGRFAFNPALGQFVITPSNLPVDEGLFTTAAQAFRRTGNAGTLAGRLNDSLPQLPFVNADIYGAHVQINWHTPIGTVTVIPAWRHASRDLLSTQAGQSVGNTQDSDQESIEARLVSNPNRTIDYILGAFYFREHLDDDVHNSSGASANFVLAQYNTRSPSAYARLTWHATDWLRFTGGLRYTEDHKSYTQFGRQLAVVCAVPANCPTAPLLPYTSSINLQPFVPAASGATVVRAPGILIARRDNTPSGSSSTNKLTYRAAVEADVAAHSLAYASIETGYRAGGFNSDTPFRPETITAYTVGMKNRFFGNRAQLNIELFDWEYHDQQLTFLGIDNNGTLGALTRNIGRARIRGAEVEALVRPLPNTTLSGSVLYSDSEYRSFVYQTPARPFVGCNVTQAGAIFTVDCTGRPLFNSPKWTVNLGAQQIVPMGNLQLVLNVDTQYRSGREVGFEFLPIEHVGSTWLSNAQVSLGRVDGRWEIGAFVRNIENNRAATFATPAPGTNLIVSTNASPRTYGLRLSTHF